jgi:hypothetical protein
LNTRNAEGDWKEQLAAKVGSEVRRRCGDGKQTIMRKVVLDATLRGDQIATDGEEKVQN